MAGAAKGNDATAGRLDGPTLFRAGAYRCVELAVGHVPILQRFFEDNPEYQLAISGEGPTPNEGRDGFESRPPAGWRYDRIWMLGFTDDDATLAAMANVTEGLLAEGVWHIGLFIVATALHGRGAAQAFYGGLESWMRGHGAYWVRLGVVVGNARAERFWPRQGYVEMRRAEGIVMGQRTNAVRMMAKPLRGGTMSEYLDLVARDRPASP